MSARRAQITFTLIRVDFSLFFINLTYSVRLYLTRKRVFYFLINVSLKNFFLWHLMILSVKM